MVVTKDSFILMVHRQHRDHKRALNLCTVGATGGSFKKPDVSDLVATAELSCAAWAAVNEVQRMLPIPDTKMRSKFHNNCSPSQLWQHDCCRMAFTY